MSLWLLAVACCPTRGGAEAEAPPIEEERIVVGSLPSIAGPSTPRARMRKDSSWAPDCQEGWQAPFDLTPVECSPTCTGHEVFVRYCAEGHQASRIIEANCASCPTTLPAGLAQCRIDYATIKPSELSSIDGCKLELTCGNEKLVTECDGENDGTNTSLCDCKINGKEARHVSNPVRGEAPEACLRAAEKCLSPPRR
jgi:hypothetical protein